jgi:hypothetical protein
MADSPVIITRPSVSESVNFPSLDKVSSNVYISNLDGSSFQDGTSLQDASSFYSGLSVAKYIMIILIIVFLAFNIFATLGDLTTTTNSILQQIISFFGYAVGDTVKQTTNIAAKGVKFGADVTANAVDSTVNIMEESIESNDNKYDRDDNEDGKPFIVNKKARKVFPTPSPDDATSSTQRNQQGKTGYCYIGEDRGFRSCIKMEDNDKCMSGNIFSSEEICLNPALRE